MKILLYVKAVYQLDNAVQADVKASLYTNQLKIEGFGNTKEREIKLYAVDRSGNESDPVTVKIQPLVPPIFAIFEKIKLQTDFGGVRISWLNETAANISIILLHKVSGEYVPVEAIYTKRKEGIQSVRGMESKESEFGLVIKDRWDNATDTLFATLTPLFEMKVPTEKIRPYTQKGDTPDAWGWVLFNLWDDNVNTGFHTGPDTPLPHRFTFQLVDGPVKISRFKVVPRRNEFYYINGHLRKIELFGSNNPAVDGSYEGWQSMGQFESTKPSKLPFGEISNEDIEYANNGEEFSVDPSLPAFKYFRLKMLETWSGGIPCHLMELPMWGCPEGYVSGGDQ